MLDLTYRHEALALLAYIADGDDPEPTAALWAAATMAEVQTVVHHAVTINPREEGSEWLDDFRSAHKWLRRRGYTTPDAARRALAASDLNGGA